MRRYSTFSMISGACDWQGSLAPSYGSQGLPGRAVDKLPASGRSWPDRRRNTGKPCRHRQSYQRAGAPAACGPHLAETCASRSSFLPLRLKRKDVSQVCTFLQKQQSACRPDSSWRGAPDRNTHRAMAKLKYIQWPESCIIFPQNQNGRPHGRRTAAAAETVTTGSVIPFGKAASSIPALQ